MKQLREKYTNYQDDFFITQNKIEVEFFVNRYIDETWSFDGNNVKIVTNNSSSTVKIPDANLSIPEFLSYSDEIARYRASLVEVKPKQLEPKKF